jgi:hypothetical protein
MAMFSFLKGHFVRIRKVRIELTSYAPKAYMLPLHHFLA